jgi:hypothetical protein
LPVSLATPNRIVDFEIAFLLDPLRFLLDDIPFVRDGRFCVHACMYVNAYAKTYSCADGVVAAICVHVCVHVHVYAKTYTCAEGSVAAICVHACMHVYMHFRKPIHAQMVGSQRFACMHVCITCICESLYMRRWLGRGDLCACTYACKCICENLYTKTLATYNRRHSKGSSIERQTYIHITFDIVESGG